MGGAAVTAESGGRAFLEEGFERIELDPDAHLLVVAPHPDDEVISFGAALSEHVQRGGRVTVVGVTDGEASDDRADSSRRVALADERAAERLRALRVLGIDAPEVVRLGFADGHVALEEAPLTRILRHLLRTTLRQARCPPVVVAPWRHDLHTDHEASGRAVARAVAGLPVVHLEVPIWGWYESWAAPPPRLTRRGVPVADAAREAKLAAMACFTSQLTVLPSGRGPVLPADFMEAFDRAVEPVVA